MSKGQAPMMQWQDSQLARCRVGAAGVALAVALAGCAVGPTPTAPVVPDAGVASSYRSAQSGATTIAPADWWASFADPTLLALMHDGIAANADVAIAVQRVRQARANLNASAGGFLPAVGFSAGRSRLSSDSLPAATETTNLALTASYEVDLFGGKRRAYTAASADRDVAAENLRSVRISVLSEIAINYVSARTAGRRLQLAEDNIRNQRDTLQLVRWRATAGLASDVEVAQAAQLTAQTEAVLPDLQQALDAAVNRLATLTGATGTAVAERLGHGTEIPVAPIPSAGLAVDTLRQRPDVRAAERSTVAELARVGVREAAILPALTLGGSYSGLGATWSAATRSPALQLTGLLAGSLFRGGQDWAAMESQKAAAAAAAANYRGVVRAAMEELENALRAVTATQDKTIALTDADAAAQHALELAQIRYRSGLTDFQSLLDTQRTALSSQQSLVQAQADRAIAAIRLYKALGGGWSVATDASPASE